MLQTSFSRFKYNPNEINEEDFLNKFVIRHEEFEEIFDDIRNSDYSVPTQHYIIVGQRGQGKTTLLRRISIAIQKDKNLSSFLLPIQFSEEQYQIRSLSRLWEVVAEYLEILYKGEFDSIVDVLEKKYETDDDYELNCFSYLESEINKKKKKVVLLIDNIDELFAKLSSKEQKRLREILISSSCLKIIGGSTKMFEHQYDYAKPFYEFFKIINLKGLNIEEAIKLLKTIANDEQKEQIEYIIQKQKSKIETLLQLTGGVPRMIVMLFDIFITDNGNAFDDLLKLLDDVTPLYKHRMDDLPPVLQDIVDTLALNWDGMLAREISNKTRLESKAVSAQLKQLEKYNIVDVESIGKNNIYKIKERFFNIWYLMRYGRKKDRTRVEWLVKFISSWYSKEELEKKSLFLIDASENKKISEHYLFYMCEALSFTGLIDSGLEFDLKESTKKYLQKINSKYLFELTPSIAELLAKVEKLVNTNNIDKAIDLLENSKKNVDVIFFQLAKLYKIEKKYDKAFEVIKRIHNLEFPDEFLNFIFGIYPERTLLIAKERYVKNQNDSFRTFFLSLILLWNEYYEESYMKFIESLKKIENSDEVDVKEYLILLIAKGQFYKVKELLEMKDYNLREKYKPIWYALMKLMKEEFSNELKRMGSELDEIVNEILEKVEEYKIKYKK